MHSNKLSNSFHRHYRALRTDKTTWKELFDIGDVISEEVMDHVASRGPFQPCAPVTHTWHS